MPRAKRQTEFPVDGLEQLSDEGLREVAGPAVLARGMAYFREGRVELRRDTGLPADFEAHGTLTYAVVLSFDGGSLGMFCNCPHAEDGNFCKHAVAAAMVWRAKLGGAPSPTANTAPAPNDEVRAARAAKIASAKESKRQALFEFLRTQPAAALAERLHAAAQQDSGLMAELKAWAASAGAAGDPKALRAAVDALLKISSRQFLERREVREWAARAQKAVTLLRDGLPQHPAEVRAVAELALRRVQGVAQRAYESPAEVDEVQGALMGVVIKALHLAPPAAAWADQLLQRIEDDDGDLWQDPRVVQAAGPDVQRAYTRRLADRWKVASARAVSEKSATRFDVQRGRLRRLMLQDLERQRDPLALFEFMKRSASGLGEHVELIRWCEANGRQREALQLARAACKLHDNHPLVEELLLAAYERDGWDAEALAIWQRRFDHRPMPETYAGLMKAAASARADWAALRDGAFARVQALEQAELQQRATSARRFGGPPPVLNVSWRAAMLMLDGDIDQALALVQPPHTCDPGVLEALADQLPKERDAAAFKLLDRIFSFAMLNANSTYKEPLRVLAKALRRRGPEECRAHLLEVGKQHKRKLNFIAGLPRLPP